LSIAEDARIAMTTLSTPVRPANAGLADRERLVRDALFLATFLLTWFTVSPFPDLSNPALLLPQTHGNLLGQVSTVLLTGSLAAFVFFKRSPLLPRIVTVPLVLTLAAFVASCLLSAYPPIALRRLLLAGFTIFQAATLILLPNGREHFARLLAAAAIIVLAACYIGVAFFPHYSIHQATDLAEPGLAGDWRGFFMHKNGAGAAMVALIFIGIFVARTWDRTTGIAIIVLAGIFLVFTHSRSPRNLLPIVLALSYLIPRIRSPVLAWGLVVLLAAGINVLTVGSVMFAPIGHLIGFLLFDPTFDGRNVIWRFALAHVSMHPLFGFGYQSFWRMPDLILDWNYLESWGYRASDAHNAYLNLAVTTGLVGLALSMTWVVGQAFADFRQALALHADRALTILFLQIWLFGICLGGFESVLFSGGDCIWFLVISSIVGFRFLSLARTSR
jgi:O-antigen ligase